MLTDYRLLRRYTILNYLNHFGSLSRKKLIALTDYRPASVTELVKELIEEGLVVESGQLIGGIGRRRTLLSLNNNSICAIGVLLSYYNVTYVLSQMDGTIVEKSEIRVDDPHAPDLAGQVTGEILRLIKNHPEREVVGIGLADPLFDEAHFNFTSSLPQVYEQYVDWARMELPRLLEKSVDVPVRAFSANALPALAEQHFGSAKGKTDVVCIELSNGLGSSVIAGGTLVTGYQGRAGEFGHTTINFGLENRTMCYCGKTGCVEADAAFPYIRNNIRSALKNGTFSALLDFYNPDTALTVRDIRRGLDMGDILCEHYVRESARRIGAAIANIVNVLNPEIIVLFGFMTELGDFFINEIKSILRRNTLVFLRDYQVVVNTEMEEIMPLGAAAEMFSEYLHSDDFSYIYRLPLNEGAETEESMETEDGPEDSLS